MKYSYLVASLALVTVVTSGCGLRQTIPADSLQETTAETPVQETTDSATTADTQPTTALPAEVKEFVMTAKSWEFQPNTITVNQGDQVRLKITSLDIEHGFNIPDYGIKVNLLPQEEKIVEFTADQVGTFGFRCSVLCGDGHRDMIGQLIVQ